MFADPINPFCVRASSTPLTGEARRGSAGHGRATVTQLQRLMETRVVSRCCNRIDTECWIRPLAKGTPASCGVHVRRYKTRLSRIP
eukprot:727382-Prymnesium_polylepis.2